MFKNLAALTVVAALFAAPAQAARSTGGIAPTPHRTATSSHRPPLSAPFALGDGFGVDRPGHMHQGIDLLAPKGTPVVAPHGGVVTRVAYQAGGAGYYVVLSGTGEHFDYVFMHMVKGSVRVSEGQTIGIGRRIGDLGSTGASSGPHLHFEIWKGAWATGGEAVDPAPYLRAWATSRTASRNR